MQSPRRLTLESPHTDTVTNDDNLPLPIEVDKPQEGLSIHRLNPLPALNAITIAWPIASTRGYH